MINKYTQTKSPTYIDATFLNYKFTYNNTNDINPQRGNQFLPIGPPKGRVLDMIHKDIYSIKK